MAAAGPAEVVQQSEGSKEVEGVAKATAAVTLPDPEQVEPPRVIAGHARPTATAIMAAAGPAEAVQQSEGSKEEEKAAMAAAAAAEASENSIEPQSANEA
jgi:ribosomal protein S5